MISLDYQENGHRTGTLSLRNSCWLKRLTAQPRIVSIIPAFAQGRQEVEDFIIDIYAQSYGAQIGVHYPVLMSVRDDENKIMAAVGFRYAAQEKLFLEQYLKAPVDHILETPRENIVEIGNLASRGGGASIFLFAAMAAYLQARGQTHAVVTSTNFLERRFREMGLKPIRLAPADPSRLLMSGENWGTYYDTQPHVLAGQIGRGYQCLQRALGAHYTEDEPRLYPRLHYRSKI